MSGGSPRSRSRLRRCRTRYAALLAPLWLLLTGVAIGAVAAPIALAQPAADPTAGAPPPLSAWGAPGVSGADRMGAFAVTFELDRDGGILVTETISYSFDSSQGPRRGIVRAITVRQRVEEQPELFRAYAISQISAYSPTNAPADVTGEDRGGVVVIRVGNPNRTVVGTQTYVLRYHLAHVANAIADQQTAELYYNLFKDDQIPKSSVQVQVSAPVAATSVRCWRSSNAACQVAEAGSPARFTVTNLGTDEDLTIAAQYPRSAFGDLTPDLRRGTVEGGQLMDETAAKSLVYATLAGALLAPLLAFGGMAALVATRGRDEWYAGLTPGLTPGATRRLPRPPAGPGATPADRPPDPTGGSGVAPDAAVTRDQPGTVAVQFTPPPGVQPGLVGTIVDESADTVDVSASVVDLAVRGYLRIEEVDSGGVFSRTDWQLTALQPDAATAGLPLRPYEQALLTGLFQDGSPVLLSSLKNNFAQTLASVKSLMYDEALHRQWFRSSPDTARNTWRALGFLLVGVGGAVAFFYGRSSELTDVAAGLSLPFGSGRVLGIGLALAGFIVQFFGGRMAAKTAEGSAVLAQALGFRRYLETAEANQIRWEEAQDMFSRFLPYAIVFGVAERWAAVFQQVAAAAAASGQVVVMPDWYVYHGSTFPDFGSISSAVDSFATAASGTFTATPGSSGGSAFGGSGGGGFSGGGVGGSSSGSW